MKFFIKTLGFIALLAFAFVPAQILRADDINAGNSNVTFQTFYDQLQGQGNWIQTSDYGPVFQPTVNDPNWRPYKYGNWVNTDQGMMWNSDESFGWATYHYGRWVNLDNYGWVWVPGYTWAPAWVSWREGDDQTADDYVGWAPLPPDTLYGIDYFDDGFFGLGLGYLGFYIGNDCDVAFGIGPGCYNFCPVAYIGDRDCWRHFGDPRDNFARIGHTRNVTNISYNRNGRDGEFGHVHEGGPNVAALNAHAHNSIRHEQLTSASSLAGNGRVHGNSLAVYAPSVDPKSSANARPHNVNGSITNPSVNRGTDINQPLAVNSSLKPAGPTADQVHAASLAQGNLPAGAKVDTAKTTISRPLTEPLAALHPNTFNGANEHRNTTFSNSNVTHTTPFRAPTHVASSSVQHSSVTPGVTHATPHVYSSNSGFNPFTGEGVSHNSSVFHSVFHNSAPSYHPSFHSFAPSVQHFGGGAPAMHFGGGGGGGAPHFSGGGGAPHFSGGGGAPHFSGGGGGGHPGGGGGGGHGGHH